MSRLHLHFSLMLYNDRQTVGQISSRRTGFSRSFTWLVGRTGWTNHRSEVKEASGSVSAVYCAWCHCSPVLSLSGFAVCLRRGCYSVSEFSIGGARLEKIMPKAILWEMCWGNCLLIIDGEKGNSTGSWKANRLQPLTENVPWRYHGAGKARHVCKNYISNE